MYVGVDRKQIGRATFCQQAIKLALNIKNHFKRVLRRQENKNIVLCYVKDITMPVSMTSVDRPFEQNVELIAYLEALPKTKVGG